MASTDSACPLKLCDDTYFSAVPVLLIDTHGRVADANLAFEVLLGDAINCFWRGQCVEELSDALRLGSDEGIIPHSVLRLIKSLDDKSDGRPELAHYLSAAYGQIAFRVQVVRYDTGDRPKSGTIACYWSLELIDRNRFQNDVTEAWNRERTWMQYAASYDRVLSEMPYYRQALRRHLAVLCAAGAKHVADLGAGTGNMTQRLLQSGQSVVAVDSSRAMLARLCAKPWACDHRLAVYQQSAECMPNIEAGTFDAVNILLVLYNTSNPHRLLAEAIRILRPGGVIVITEPRRHFHLQVIIDRCRQNLERVGKAATLSADFSRVIDANEKFDPSQVENRIWADDLQRILRDRYFRNIEFRPSHYGQCGMVTGLKSDV